MDAQAMTHLTAALQLTPAAPLGALTFFAVGALIGTVYFLTLRWNVHIFASSGAPLVPMAIQLLRLALLAATLAVIAKSCGALALILAVAGLFVARSVILRRGAPQ
jgi:F1F0 ATPase subunit 2